MAGIGFVLKKLSREDNLIGTVKSFFYSAFVTSGPWFFTIITLSLLTIFALNADIFETIYLFKVITIYNFAFSMVFTAPFGVIATRYLSDVIYQRNFNQIPSVLIGALTFTIIVQTPIAALFYAFVIDMPAVDKLLSVYNYLILCLIWMSMVFLSAVKGYKGISFAFLLGMASLFGLSILLAPTLKTTGFLIAMNMGLTVILLVLVSLVVASYPFNISRPFAFLKYMVRYWDLALAELCGAVAIWVDKWIMWFSPERIKIPEGFIFYTSYDSALFMAYISILPALALFLIFVETSFFNSYQEYLKIVKDNSVFSTIKKSESIIIKALITGLRDTIILQGIITTVVILGAPGIFQFIGAGYEVITIFQLGTLGILFQTLTLFIITFFSYFDLRRSRLATQFVFLASNGILTYIFMGYGFSYYGMGYMISCIITFLFAFLLGLVHSSNISFLVFMTNNKNNRV